MSETTSNIPNAVDNNGGQLANIPNVLDIMNQGQTTQDDNIIKSVVSSPNFLTDLVIATGVSKAVKERRVCFPGDLCLGGQVNLQQKCQVVPITWRLRAREYDNNTKKFGDSAYFCKDLGSDSSAYDAFVKKARPAKVDVTEGVEFLIYLPAQNVFCLYFLRSTQQNAINQLRMFPGRLCTISPEAKEGRNGTWYLTNVMLENRTLKNSKMELPGTTLIKDIDVDPELLQKSFQLFLKPSTVTTDTDNTAELNN